MKRFVSLAIVLFWLFMVGLLVRRNLPQPQPQSSAVALPAASTLQAQEEWMGIYHQDQKVGYLQRRLTPTDAGYQWDEQWRMRLRVLDTPQTIHTEVRADTDQHYALTRFSFRLLSAGAVFQVTGEVTNQTLRGQITTGGETSPFSFPLREPLYLPTTTQMALRGVALQPGEERRFSIFNPLSLRTDTISVTAIGAETLSLKGEKQPVIKVAERFAGTTVHAWLDQEGKVVKEEAALGLVLLRESQEDALGGGWQDSTPLDLVTSAAIPVRQTLPDPRALTHLRLKLSGPDDALSFAFPPRQQQQDNTLTITQEEMSALATYALPQTNPEFALDLAPTPFLQSTHPRLVAQVQQILGAERDALQAVRRLLDWTYTTLDKTPTVGMPTALEALESKKGDCNEHAVLFTALARAAGLPARVAAGVVYLDGAFYYHAWAEVWLGQWVAVDPVFHQFPADATHVKFVEGGPEQHLALLKVIGQVGIEVVEYK
ncbi:MAG: transglutaminase domain-containing protein [Deltaproteobacteria bacterium]|nr:transglutaminase domain-containing protein [Deltaproteobacteria bacterium]